MRKLLSILAAALIVPLLFASPPARADGLTGYVDLGGGVSGSSFNDVKDAGAARVDAGVMFTENYAAEVGYLYFGKFKFKNAPDGNYVEDRGPYIALAGYEELTPRIDLTGKVGVLHFNQSVHTNGVRISSDHGNSALLGVGLDFYLNREVALGTEFTYLTDVNSEHIASGWLMLHITPGASPMAK